MIAFSMQSWCRAGVGGPPIKIWMVLGFAVVLIVRSAICGALDIHIAEPSSAAAIQLKELVRAEVQRSPEVASNSDVTVTIGAAAFRTALRADGDRQIIATFLTSTDFYSAIEGSNPSPNVTAVFSNPDPRDQVLLARFLLGAPRLGAFDSPKVSELTSGLWNEGVTRIPLGSGESVEAIARSANQLDAIVALPDPTVLNQSNVGPLVRALYSRRKVLIGYSDTLTGVGSLASVYVNPEAAVRKVGEVLRLSSLNGKLPEPSFVEDIDVSVNEQLARSLNLIVPDESALRDAIRAERNRQLR